MLVHEYDGSGAAHSMLTGCKQVQRKEPKLMFSSRKSSEEFNYRLRLASNKCIFFKTNSGGSIEPTLGLTFAYSSSSNVAKKDFDFEEKKKCLDVCVILVRLFIH